jgi:hypothetical protein
MNTRLSEFDGDFTNWIMSQIVLSGLLIERAVKGFEKAMLGEKP